MMICWIWLSGKSKPRETLRPLLGGAFSRGLFPVSADLPDTLSSPAARWTHQLTVLCFRKPARRNCRFQVAQYMRTAALAGFPRPGFSS